MKNSDRVSSSAGLTRWSVRLGLSVTGLMLAGTALAPASAQTLDLTATPQPPLSTLAGFTTVTNGPLTMNIAGAGTTETFGGALTDGVNPLSLTKQGSGVFVLTGTGLNTYSGLTTLQAGTLRAGADNALSPNSIINVTGSGAVLDLFGTDQTVPGLIGSNRTITNSLTGDSNLATLTVINSDPVPNVATNQFRGFITGNIRIVKDGVGLQGFSDGSSYTGGTELKDGFLVFSNDSSFGSGDIDSTGNGTLRAGNTGRTLANDINIEAGTRLTIEPINTTLAGKISGDGELRKVAQNLLVLTNADNDFGSLLFEQGRISAVTGALGSGTVTTLNQVTLATPAGGTASYTNAFDLGGILNFELVGASDSISLTGPISGANGQLFLKDDGPGTLNVSGTNSFGQGVLLAAGTFGIGSNTAAGVGGVISAGAGNGIRAIADGLVIDNVVDLAFTLPVDTQGFTLTLAGEIKDRSGVLPGGLNKTGSGTLNLTGDSTYTGGTTITAGRLNVNGSIVGDVDVLGGATLGGSGDIGGGGIVTVASGGIVSAGTSPGTLTVDNLLLASGSSLDFELTTPGAGGPGNDLIDVTGTLTVSPSVTINVTPLAGFDEGSYRLINYGTKVGGNTAFVLGATTIGEFNLTLDQVTPSQINLNSVFTGIRYWDGAGPFGGGAVNGDGGNGNWEAVTQNWTNAAGTATLAWPTTPTAVAGVFAGAAGNVTVIGTQNFTTLEFRTAGYTLGGAGTISAAGGTINANNAGTTTINTVIAGSGGLTKTGSGTLVLGAANTFTGGYTSGADTGVTAVGTNASLGVGAATFGANTTLQALGTAGQSIGNAIGYTGPFTIDGKDGFVSLTGIVSGNGALTLTATGPASLSRGVDLLGANLFTGGVTLNTVVTFINADTGFGNAANTLAVNSSAVFTNGSTTSTRAITITGESFFGGADASVTYTLNGEIQGTGRLNSAFGTVVLGNATNSYQGGTEISSGTLSVASDGALGAASGGVSFTSDTLPGITAEPPVLRLTASVTSARAIDIATGVTGTIDTVANNVTLGGTISGGGKLAKVGTGVLTLGGPNTYAGGTDLISGTIAVTNNGSLGDGLLTIFSDATLRAGAPNITIANLITSAGNGLIDQGGAGNVFTLSNIISGPGSISAIGAGTLVLNGNNGFVNLGINNGTVQVGSNTAAGIGFIALNSNATLQSGGAAITLGNELETTGNGLVNVRTGEVLTLNGSVGGAGSISQVGPGTLVLNGNNGFRNLGINNGTVQVGSNTAAGVGFIALNSDATLQSGAAAVALGNDVETTGNGLVNVRTGEVLTLNGSVGGAGSISQIGPGTLVLNGNNGFRNLGINNGTVRVGSNTAAGVGFIALNSNATLQSGGAAITLGNELETTGNGLVNVRTGEVLTLNGSVGGAGSISQVGPGTLVLNGNNGFRNLGINNGTVRVGSNTAAGIGFIALNSNATLQSGGAAITLGNELETTGNGLVNVRTGEVLTLNGSVGGAGSISQIGPGTLVLNGNNGFRNLGINNGTVQVGSNTAAGSRFIALNSNATLQSGGAAIILANELETTGNGIVNVRTGEALTLNGSVGGVGSLTKTGSGQLNLTAANNYAGGTILNAGTIRFAAATSLGSGSVTVNAGTLLANSNNLNLANILNFAGAGTIDTAANALTVSGVVGGSGRITKAGTGNLTLAGTGAFTGGLTIAAGSVTGTVASLGAGGILNNAALVINQTTDATFSQVISGTGSLSKVGSGALTIAAVNTVTGPTTVTAGRLNVTGSLAASAVTVQTGASLTGTGSVGALTAQAGSTISPGTTPGLIGTLTVNGALTLAAGSTYAVDASPSGGGDRITATGPASIAGNLIVTPGGTGTPSTFNQNITLISSSARTGTFATTTLGSFGPAIMPTVIYDATSVILRLAPGSLVAAGGSNLAPNALAVARSFDTAVANGYNPQAFFALYAQGTNLPNALSELSGEVHSAERRVLLEDTRVVRETVFDRLNAGLAAVAGTQSVSTNGADGKAITFWLRGAGSWGTADADGVGSRFTTEQRGVLTGIDYATQGFKVGGLFHYTSTDVEFAALGKSKVESIGGALYAGYRQEGSGLAVGLGASIASNKADSSRAITAPGLQQSLKGKVDGTTYQIFVEAAFDLVKAENTRVEPFGRIAYANVDSKAFAESGGIAAVNGAEHSNDLTLTTVGVRAAYVSGIATLSGSAGWARTSGDRSASTILSITGPNTPFVVNAVALDEDAVALEAQASFNLSQTITLGVGYSGLVGANNADHGARATLTVGF